MARQDAFQPPADKAALKRRFGTAVRMHREQLGITQRQLAARTKIARTYLADVERGARNPCLSIIVRIASGMELSLSMLFSTFELLVAVPSSSDPAEQSPTARPQPAPAGKPADIPGGNGATPPRGPRGPA